MEGIDILGLVAGVFTSSASVPQLVKTIRKKQANDVSTFMFLVLIVGNGLWVYYGTEKSDIAIIATNALAILLNVAMLICKFLFRKNG